MRTIIGRAILATMYLMVLTGIVGLLLLLSDIAQLPNYDIWPLGAKVLFIPVLFFGSIGIIYPICRITIVFLAEWKDLK